MGIIFDHHCIRYDCHMTRQGCMTYRALCPEQCHGCQQEAVEKKPRRSGVAKIKGKRSRAKLRRMEVNHES